MSRVCASLFGTVVPPCLLMLVVDVAVKMSLGAEPLPASRTLTNMRPIVIPFVVTMAELAQDWLITTHFLEQDILQLVWLVEFLVALITDKDLRRLWGCGEARVRRETLSGLGGNG